MTAPETSLIVIMKGPAYVADPLYMEDLKNPDRTKRGAPTTTKERQR